MTNYIPDKVTNTLTAELLQNTVSQEELMIDYSQIDFTDIVDETSELNNDFTCNDSDDTFEVLVHDGSPKFTDSHNEALSVIAGSIAFKLKKCFPELSANEAMHLPELNRYGWIEALSNKGVSKPTDAWMTNVLKFEKVFQAIHKDSLSKENGIIKKLQYSLSVLFPEVNTVILKQYSRTRTYSRIKYINENNKLITQSLREAKKKGGYAK